MFILNLRINCFASWKRLCLNFFVKNIKFLRSLFLRILQRESTVLKYDIIACVRVWRD